MKELNLRKKKFYNLAMRSFVLLVVLFILLATTNVEITRLILSLFIIGILLFFAYITEVQLPLIIAKIPQIGTIISSVIHILVIIIAYIYLLPFATDKVANLSQILKVIFLLLICIPLLRSRKAFYKVIDLLTAQTANVLEESKSSIENSTQYVFCKICNSKNTLTSKYCRECGNTLQETKEVQVNRKDESNSSYEERKEFRLSVAHPFRFSKRFESVILCQIYLPESRSRALKNIKIEFQEQLYDEKIKPSLIKLGQKVTVKLDGSDFSFSEPVTKIINNSLNKFAFIAKPNDDCESGYHKIKVSVIDTITGEEFDYLMLGQVQVVDFAFDHISRPLLSRIFTVVLGIGSFTMFILTFLEQIDKTIGLTSGTAAGVLAVGIYASFYNLYQRIHSSSP